MISVMSSAASFRTEKDLLGVLEVPAQAYYGIQTLRAVNNFRLSGVPISHYPKLVVGLAMVKQAAADANRELGQLSEAKHAAISEACARLIRGDFHEEFVVDMIQGGAGTSTNMNANEVIANIALEAMGHSKGEYQYLHPNNDVNMAQSTNDAYPTAIRLGLLLGHDALLASLDSLIQAFAAKGEEFSHVLKMGRTQLQDAVPMTLGQEFRAFATTLGEDLARLKTLAPELLTEVNLGGTAIGTGINADPRYQAPGVTGWPPSCCPHAAPRRWTSLGHWRPAGFAVRWVRAVARRVVQPELWRAAAQATARRGLCFVRRPPARVAVPAPVPRHRWPLPARHSWPGHCRDYSARWRC